MTSRRRSPSVRSRAARRAERDDPAPRLPRWWLDVDLVDQVEDGLITATTRNSYVRPIEGHVIDQLGMARREGLVFNLYSVTTMVALGTRAFAPPAWHLPVLASLLPVAVLALAVMLWTYPVVRHRRRVQLGLAEA